LKDLTDPGLVSGHWTCAMAPDNINCDTVEDPANAMDQFVPGDFIVGNVVWVELSPFPPWPAIIDDNPDTKASIWMDKENPGEPVKKCHVVFFDSLDGYITRSWADVNQIKPFKGSESLKTMKRIDLDEKTWNNLGDALVKARKAYKMDLESRRKLYCILYKIKKSSKKYYCNLDGCDVFEIYLPGAVPRNCLDF
jgi:hypothetical protein